MLRESATFPKVQVSENEYLVAFSTLNVFLRKCRSARFYASQWLTRREHQRRAKKRRQAFDSWLRRLDDRKPEILIGANFVAMGGTRQHMHALHRYSMQPSALMPDEECLRHLTPWDLATEFGQEFSSWRPKSAVAVHSHVFPWYINWCMLQKKTYGTKWVHTHHNWYYPEFGRNGLESWQQEFNEHFLIALRNADVCLSVSRSQQRFLRTTFGIETEYLPNGVDVDACDRGRAERWVESTGRDGAILYVGRNDPVKNPVAFVQLAQMLPGLQFVMLGEGLSTETLQDEWSICPPENLFIQGNVSHARVQDAIAACSVLVMTSRREGLPTLALEAMTQGKSIVVPEEEGCMEAVSYGEFGFIYQPDNISDLAEKTLKARRDVSRCSGARDRILQEFNWPVIATKLEKFYHR